MTGESLGLEEWDATLAEAGPREDVAALAREARAELERLRARVAELEASTVVPDPDAEVRPLKTRDQQDAEMLRQLLDLAQELNVGYVRLDQVHAQVGPLWARLLEWRDGRREPLPTVAPVPVPVELVASLGPVEPPDLPPTGYLPKSWEATTAIEGWVTLATYRRAYADLLTALEVTERQLAAMRLPDFTPEDQMYPDNLKTVVFEALGEVSMCWEPRPTGVFESTRAKEIGERLWDQINAALAGARTREA